MISTFSGLYGILAAVWVLGELKHSMSLGSISSKALGIAAIVLGAVVAVIILAALFPTYSGSVGNLSENVTAADWGDPTANELGPVFGMLVALGGLFAIVGLVFVAYNWGKAR